MLTMLAGWLGKSVLMQSPVGSFVKGISPKTWKIIAIIGALVLAFVWHQHTVHRDHLKHEGIGYARALKDVAERQKKIDAAALKLKQKIDALGVKISQQEHRRYEEEIAHNHALADALRLRYQQHAGPARGSGQALPRAATAASATGKPQPTAYAGMATVLAGDLIDHAEQCDNDHAARIGWDRWYDQLVKAWPK